MNIDILQLFCYAVEHKNISAAAKKNYLSQPAATKKIRQLETHYSVLLFERENNTLQLTEAGEKLYQYAKNITKEYDQSVEEIQALRNEQTRTLKIGASYTLGEYVLPEIMSEYQKHDPELYIKLSINSTPTVLKDLEEREIDIAFVEGDIQNNGLEKQVITNDVITLITSTNHKWAARKHIVPNDLLQGRMISREQDSATRKIIEEHLSEKIKMEQIKNRLELSTTQAIKSAVQSDLGYGFVSRLAVSQELKAGLLSEIDISGISIQRPLWTTYRLQRFPKDSITEFDEFAKSFLQERSEQ
ncbi:LysR family transcriptional regulator [Virgibacillus ainsalahensis]